MTKMRTTYLGNLRTEILHEQSGNKIITDAPLDNHGKGEYFSPTDANPRRVARIVVDITFPKGQKYDDKAKRLIESAARTCPVSNSLHPDIVKDIRFHYDE